MKIDQSFIKDVTENPQNAAIVQAIIALAKPLNLNVIAEGVETADQRQFLIDHDCSEMQGCLICESLVAEAFADLMKRP